MLVYSIASVPCFCGHAYVHLRIVSHEGIDAYVANPRVQSLNSVAGIIILDYIIPVQCKMLNPQDRDFATLIGTTSMHLCTFLKVL